MKKVSSNALINHPKYLKYLDRVVILLNNEDEKKEKGLLCATGYVFY